MLIGITNWGTGRTTQSLFVESWEATLLKRIGGVGPT